MDKVYIKHPDSDKDNLTIAYVTLDRKFPVTVFAAVSLFKEVSKALFTVQTYFLMGEHKASVTPYHIVLTDVQRRT